MMMLFEVQPVIIVHSEKNEKKATQEVKNGNRRQ